jgi:hypothetical protein
MKVTNRLHDTKTQTNNSFFTSVVSAESLASFYADSLNAKVRTLFENQKAKKRKIKIGIAIKKI